jgi:hypothetical protein
MPLRLLYNFMLDSNSVVITLGACGIVLVLHVLFQHTLQGAPLPRSPQSYPLVGHLFSMPQRNGHIGFIELGKKLNSM